LRDLYLHLTGQQTIQQQAHVEAASVPLVPPTDFREIKGQEHVKRALEIAAAGGHNMIMLWTKSRTLFHSDFALRLN